MRSTCSCILLEETFFVLSFRQNHLHVEQQSLEVQKCKLLAESSLFPQGGEEKLPIKFLRSFFMTLASTTENRPMKSDSFYPRFIAELAQYYHWVTSRMVTSERKLCVINRVDFNDTRQNIFLTICGTW